MKRMNESSQLSAIMKYAAELELEVDRLRRREQFLRHETQRFSQDVFSLSENCDSNDSSADSLRSVSECSQAFRELLADVDEPPGYHPAFDQVIAVAVRPLAESTFRWHQRVNDAHDTTLRLQLDREYIEWFPARLRHILDNLFSNALRFRDPEKGEMRVGLQLRTTQDGYELRFTDNGLGMSPNETMGMFEIFYRAAPTRSAGLGVGLAVVKFLVEQCCGTLSIESGKGQGTSIHVVLPRYDLHDHVDFEDSRTNIEALGKPE